MRMGREGQSPGCAEASPNAQQMASEASNSLASRRGSADMDELAFKEADGSLCAARLRNSGASRSPVGARRPAPRRADIGYADGLRIPQIGTNIIPVVYDLIHANKPRLRNFDFRRHGGSPGCGIGRRVGVL